LAYPLGDSSVLVNRGRLTEMRYYLATYYQPFSLNASFQADGLGVDEFPNYAIEERHIRQNKIRRDSPRIPQMEATYGEEKWHTPDPGWPAADT